MNDIAKFYLFFKDSGLSNKTVDNIKLQVQGDYAGSKMPGSGPSDCQKKRMEHDGGDVFYNESGEWCYDEDG